jgi:hypothetical protein
MVHGWEDREIWLIGRYGEVDVVEENGKKVKNVN